ncbi:MAG TPA: GNAT family N-acetyltransferase [Woeseiaceae bacterium]|nr:GNAT family N-acetyltransferase [Woeseiaceae bacterium]
MTDSSHQLEIAGHTVTIRPMCHGDSEMEQEFVRRLSPEAKHYRFLGAVRELSPRELRQFCGVDGHHSMAFVATVEEGGRQRQVGVSRYAPNADGNAREIAITVADDWQHRGLGTRLAKALIQHAREHGVKKLYSVDLADNSLMRMLATDLGMRASMDPDDARQVIYSLNLAALPVAAAGRSVVRMTR